VPRDILLAVWAMESAFGQIQGNFDVVRSMASLAADGRRRAWAEGELIAALKIIASGEDTREQLKGSWAGAMGQTQFLPSNYLSTAVDWDGDGKRDIWGSDADSLASAANLLAKGGWKRGVCWAKEVILPAGFDYGLAEGPREIPSWWEAKGVKPRRRPALDRRGRRLARRPDPAGRLVGPGLPGPAQPFRDPHLQQLDVLRPGHRPAGRPLRRRRAAGRRLAGRDPAGAGRPHGRPDRL
jgi:membrane-bound lytic murein transglycosylase B